MRVYALIGVIFILSLLVAVEVTYLMVKKNPSSSPAKRSIITTISREFDCKNSDFDTKKNTYAFDKDTLCFLMLTRSNTHISTTIDQKFQGTIHKVNKGLDDKQKVVYLIYITSPIATEENEMNLFYFDEKLALSAQMVRNGKTTPIDFKSLKQGEKVDVTYTIDPVKAIPEGISKFKIEIL